MSTYNALSIFSYEQFLKDVLDIKLKYSVPGTVYSPIMIDIPYLRYPEHQAIFILPKDIIVLMDKQIEFMQNNEEDTNLRPFKGFFQFETEKLKRLRALVIHKEDSNEITIEQKDFIKFVDEHDKRRGTNFLNTFPEFTEFYNRIKDAS